MWPGVALALALALVRFGVPLFWPGFEGFRVAVLGGFAGVLLILAWWLFFSRVPHAERWGALLVLVVVLTATAWLNHPSLGLMWCLTLALPVLCIALVAWAAATRALAPGPRRLALVATMVVASGGWLLVRSDGMSGAHAVQLAWRWTRTAEERALLQLHDPTATSPRPADDLAPGAADWPGFRGARRDGVVRGVRIATDWSAHPPSRMWRRPVGPGWSSFAVHDGLLFTQEQRGDEEVVSCYRLATGEPVWVHRDPARFYESMGGPGPRATPTYHAGRVYAMGATGILNALEAADGSVVWTRDVAADVGVDVPTWGFAGSPLVRDERVVVAADGQLVAYDRATGDRLWAGPDGGISYSSPQPARIDGIDQIVFLDAAGATSVSPSDGALLWQSAWSGQAIVQPAILRDGDVLISAGEGLGVRRLAIEHGADRWRVDERWTSHRLKPNFNDFVLHDGHAYGFDGGILASIDLDDGERAWKGGRYGNGQLLLLADQAVLLVVTERGDLALVAARPEGFDELARAPGIEGKTWNHPALVDDVLLIRNGEEMAAFRLAPPADDPPG